MYNHRAKHIRQLPYVGLSMQKNIADYIVRVGADINAEKNAEVMQWLNSIYPKTPKEWKDFVEQIGGSEMPSAFLPKEKPKASISIVQPEFNIPAAEKAMADFLTAMGQDITREGLQETPKRYTKFMQQFLSPPEFEFKTFEGEGYDEMIVSRDIPFFSLCEHHLAPFFGTGTVAYIAGDTGRIVGISKLPRTLLTFASRLQNQERITQQTANLLMQELGAKGVAVSLSARHLCQEMRGVKSCATTTTTCLLGVFKTQDATRNEFLSYIKK